MFYKQKNLLHESPRYMELLIGYICAAISIGIITLLVRFAYLVISKMNRIWIAGCQQHWYVYWNLYFGRYRHWIFSVGISFDNAQIRSIKH